MIIDTTNINERVYDFLKESIVEMKYPPGHRINIQELKNELGVSQTPIKDALFRLVGEGMVEISSRRGTYVKDITDQDICEAAEARIIIETGAVEIIAQRITDEQLLELEQLYKNTLFETSEFDYYEFMKRDSEFHLGIIKLVNNSRVLQMYEQLNSHMQIVRFRAAKYNANPLSWTQQDHLDILKSLKKRDTEKAKEAIRQHCFKARDALINESKDPNGSVPPPG